MHELGIAESILDVTLAHARGRRVMRIDVSVGHLRQVVPGALRFALEVVAKGTAAEGAELAITAVPAAGRCHACGATGPLTRFPFACRACGGLAIDVTAGEELRVDAIEVEDPESEGEETAP